MSFMDSGPKVMLSISREFSFFEIIIKPPRERAKDHQDHHKDKYI